jgi:hypothetical protein
VDLTWNERRCREFGPTTKADTTFCSGARSDRRRRVKEKRLLLLLGKRVAEPDVLMVDDAVVLWGIVLQFKIQKGNVVCFVVGPVCAVLVLIGDDEKQSARKGELSCLMGQQRTTTCSYLTHDVRTTHFGLPRRHHFIHSSSGVSIRMSTRSAAPLADSHKIDEHEHHAGPLAWGHGSSKRDYC